MTDVLILCGGLGTRLRRHFSGPKFLAPVWDGRPVGLHIIEWARRQPIDNVVLAASHGRESILNAQLPVDGIDLQPEPKGETHAVRHALTSRYSRNDLLKGDVILLNGDTLFTFNIPCLPVTTTTYYSECAVPLPDKMAPYTSSGIRYLTKDFLQTFQGDLADALALESKWLVSGQYLDIGTPQGYKRVQKPWP